jgi:hypothetical protein
MAPINAFTGAALALATAVHLAFAHGDLHGEQFAHSQHVHCRCLANNLAGEFGRQFIVVCDGFTANAHDDIADH